MKLKASILKNYADLGIEKVTGEAGNSGQTPPNEGGALKKQPVAVFSERARLPRGQRGYGKEHPDNGNNGNGGNGNDGNNGGGNDPDDGDTTTGVDKPDKFVYFYHPDHLGSSSYITDVLGEVVQHIEYFAFGETFLEEHSNTDRTPYLFNGKELDEETGLYYYGARYYDPVTSVWQSVDPLAEKYPNRSPYEYTFSNPIKYLDPNGMEGIPPPEYYMNDQGFWIQGDSGFGEYIGNVAPNNGRYMELTKIRGRYYHKNTSNLFSSIGNALGGDFVGHKPYSHAEESFNDELMANAVGYGVFRVGGLAFNVLKRAGGSLWRIPAIGGITNRGVVYEKMLEAAGVIKNRFKASNFKAFDAFYKGKAWSVKTLNLLDDSYTKKPSQIYSTLKGYLDDMINFTSDSKLGQTLNNSDITSKVMELGIPRGATKAQIQQINRVIEYGAKNNIKVNVRITK